MAQQNSSTDYLFFDCDNHFYEPREAILEHLPSRYKEVFRYVEIEGRTKLVLDGRISEFIPNPTFEVVAAPGCHVNYHRGKNLEGKTMREMTTVVKAVDEYRYKTPARIDLLKQHGLSGTLLFPTLASVVEAHMSHRPDFCHAAFHSLNLWIQATWGFGQDKQFFATPVLTLMEVDKAIAEAEWIIAQGAKVVLIRPTYVPGLRGNRGMGSPEFAPVFARLEEAGIFITFHASDNGYFDVYQRHAAGDTGQEFLPFKSADPLGLVMDYNQRAHADHLASLVCHGVFERHPTLKVGYIETGVGWFYPMWERMAHVYKMQPQLFKRHPHEVIREHVWLHPHFEEIEHGKAPRLLDLVGADHVLFGSDWPHAEGLAQPSDWVNSLEGVDPVSVRKIMRDNLLGLLGIAA